MIDEPIVDARIEQSRFAEPDGGLPAELAKPARRALARAGYVRLEHLTKVSETEVMRLHGMGPKALDQLRRALAARGQSFVESPRRAPRRNAGAAARSA